MMQLPHGIFSLGFFVLLFCGLLEAAWSSILVAAAVAGAGMGLAGSMSAAGVVAVSVGAVVGFTTGVSEAAVSGMEA